MRRGAAPSFRWLTAFLLLSVAWAVLGSQPALAGDPPVHEAILDNGIRVLAVPRGDDPPTASVQVWIGAGGADEPEGKDGLAHFFEHMVFQGSEGLKPGEFDSRIEAVGGVLNAATGQDITYYYTSLPSAHVEEAIRLMGVVTSAPTFPEDQFEREREVIFREIEFRRDDPFRTALEEVLRRVHAGHPYSRSVLGTRETVAGITRDDMFRFIEEQYVPERITVVVVGDIDPDRVIEVAREAFGHIPARPGRERDQGQPPAALDRFPQRIVRDLEQVHITLGWPAPSERDDDSAAMTLLAALIDMGRSSRLERHVRRELGLVSSISSGYLGDRDRGAYIIHATMPPGNEAEVEAAIIREVERIAEGDFTPEELERARTMLLSQYVYGLESHQQLARALGSAQTVTGDWRRLFTFPDEIRAVEAEDVIEAARRYLRSDAYVRIIVGPEAAAAEAADAGVTGVEAVEPDGAAPEVTTPAELKEASPFEAAAVPAADDASQGPAVERFVLDNGHVFILQRRPHAPLIAVETMAAAGRMNEPADKPGLAALTLRMLLKGTAALPEEEFLVRVEELGGRIGGQAEADFSRLSLMSLPETFPQLLSLYADALQHPAFPGDIFEREREQLRRELRGELDDSFTRAFEGFRAALYGDHPYGTTTEQRLEALDRITLEDVRRFYRDHYAPNHLVTAVVGPIDLEATKALLAETFGGREPGPQHDLAELLAGREPGQRVDRALDGAREAGWLVVGFPAPGGIDAADAAAMEMLHTVVGSGFSSLLHEELRERMGITYTTGAVYSLRRGPSFFVTYAVTPPERDAIEQATEGILRTLTEGIEGIDEGRVARARERILGQFAMSRESTAAQAALLARYEALGLGYETVSRYPELVADVDAAQLKELARELFRPDRVVRAYLLPKEAL